MLDLPSGTVSVGRAFKEQGWEVLSLDLNSAARADVQRDVLDCDYRQFPPGHFQVITAGVPCSEFSRALTTRPRDLAKGDALMQKTFKIICCFELAEWFRENPWDGLRGIPLVGAGYCQLSDWGGRKPTRVWGSAAVDELETRTCDGRTCPYLDPRFPVLRRFPRRHHCGLPGGIHVPVLPAKKGRWSRKLGCCLVDWGREWH